MVQQQARPQEKGKVRVQALQREQVLEQEQALVLVLVLVREQA
jgi:hypothetical protein